MSCKLKSFDMTSARGMYKEDIIYTPCQGIKRKIVQKSTWQKNFVVDNLHKGRFKQLQTLQTYTLRRPFSSSSTFDGFKSQ